MHPKCRRSVVCALALVGVSHSSVFAQSPRRSKKLWIASLLAFTASSFIDLHVSRGQAETNPLLRDAQGRLSLSKGLLVKSSLSATAVTVQLLLLKSHSSPDRYTSPTILNFAAAGGLTALAVRNQRVASRLPP